MVSHLYCFIIIFLLLVCGFCPPALAQTGEGLFGSHETHYETFSLFPKWVGMLSRHRKDIKDAKTPCNGDPAQTACVFLNWRMFLKSLAGKSIMQKIDAVNRNMNMHQYVSDLANWGVDDYWETPREFLLKDGDCEDFAIAKFKSLLYLGVSNDDMRIVVLQDLNLKVDHAVLAVYVKGKAYILDNQVEQVIPAESITHYMPIYSINETGWWRHS